uniref:Uncharacterized protein n=1 Tax=Lutzomyia longipalpis TaxID=7200 RepID=A0A1B0GLP5_LUTLO
MFSQRMTLRLYSIRRLPMVRISPTLWNASQQANSRKFSKNSSYLQLPRSSSNASGSMVWTCTSSYSLHWLFLVSTK